MKSVFEIVACLAPGYFVKAREKVDVSIGATFGVEVDGQAFFEGLVLGLALTIPRDLLHYIWNYYFLMCRMERGI